MRKSLYEIAEDLKGLNDLLENLVDENGEPREPTEEENEIMKEWFNVSSDEFSKKFDNYCKFIKNLKLSSDNAKAEKDNFKAELDRLSNRSKVFENRAKTLQNLLFFTMENLKIDKFKTDLFSAGIQATPLKTEFSGNAAAIPEKYLKPREISLSAIKEGIKNGELEVIKSMVIIKDTGEILEGVTASKGSTLVIR